MKNITIGAVVASIILFIWQFLSWAMLDLHRSQMDHTPQQIEILAALNASGIDEGTYMMPRAAIGADQATAESVMNDNLGKPWAIVTYHKSMSNSMGMNMFRGWIISLISCFLLCLILSKFKDINIKDSIITAVSIGVIGYMTIPYLNSVWFEGDTIPDLIDAIVPWAIIGAFLGWYLSKSRNAEAT